jgi:hypothetical protein
VIRLQLPPGVDKTRHRLKVPFEGFKHGEEGTDFSTVTAPYAHIGVGIGHGRFMELLWACERCGSGSAALEH